VTLKRRLAWFYALVLSLALIAFAGTVWAIIEAEEAKEPPVVALLEPPDQTGGRLLIALLCALPVALAVAVGGALLIARRGLQPLEKVVTTAERISTENLSERIDASGDDEIARLVAALNSMLQRLEQSVDGMRRFTADASHELRTPLASLMGELELLLMRPRSEAELRASAESTLEEMGRLSRLVESLLTLARADAKALPMKPIDLDLADLARKTAEPYAPIRNLRWHVDGASRAHADPLWVGRIIANLVDNACKFTPEGGEVAISVQGTSIEVRDSGAGIPQGDAERIFERFYRGEAARAGTDGFGLGLPLAREIARAIGGELRLLPSEKGAAFRLDLPS
jgi:two-component system OmpR family sensor kinase